VRRDDPLQALLIDQGEVFPGREWRVPARVDLEGERLFWSEELGRVVRPERGTHREVLEGFVGLANASAKRVLAYARRWGVLRLCAHDFPATHPPRYWPSRPVEAHACPYVIIDNRDPRVPIRQGDVHPCRPRGMVDGQPWEPVAAWRCWSLKARAIVTLAAQLRNGRIGGEQDWRVAWGYEGMPSGKGYWTPPRSVDHGWRQLTEMVNHWIGAAAARIWVERREKRAEVTFGGGGLFGALAVQLAFTMGRTKSLAICDECGRGFEPNRWPRAGERHYCPECRANGVPGRNASRDYRARQAEARGLGVKASRSRRARTS
jgi:hypothetical protein